MATKKSAKKTTKAPRKLAKKAAKSASKGTSTKKKTIKKSAAKKGVAKKSVTAARAKKAAPKASGLSEKIVAAMTLTMLADGKMAESEYKMIVRLAESRGLNDVEDLGSVILRAVERCKKTGLTKALRETASGIRSVEDRERAFLACAAVASADGELSGGELKSLELLKDAFNFSWAQVRRLLGT